MTEFIDIDGIATHYHHRTGSPTLVFINSLGTDFRIWDEMIARLPPDFGVLLYDKRGHGLSDVGGTPYTIDALADDLAYLISALGIASAHICGLSIGGLIAQSLYHRHPGLVQSLIFSSTAAKIGDNGLWSDRMAAVERGGIAELAESVLPRWFSAGYRDSGGAAFNAYANMLRRQSPSGYIASCAALRDADYRDRIGDIAVPALCMVGDEDAATTPELVGDFAALIPRSRLEVLTGAGHLPCIERPERVASLITEFVEQQENA